MKKIAHTEFPSDWGHAGRRLWHLAWIGLLLLAAWPLAASSAQSLPLATAKHAIGALAVVRSDGIEDQLRGQGALAIFDGDTLKTDGKGQGLIVLADGTQVALAANTTVKLVTRWEKAKGVTPILRLQSGEIWLKTAVKNKPVEVETPVAVASTQDGELNMRVAADGQSELSTIQGAVEFASAFGSCAMRANTLSYGNIGELCTKPVATDGQADSAWNRPLLGKPPAAVARPARAAPAPTLPAIAAPAETAKPSNIQVAEAPRVAPTEPAGPTRSPAPAPIPAPAPNAPPVIALATPADGVQTTAAQVQLMGAAASDKGISALEIRVNGQLLTQRDSRGVAVKPTGNTANINFTERLNLREGKNEIVVTAIDRDHIATKRSLYVTRVKDQGTIWAVIIGISKYKNIQSLKYGDRDAIAMADYLVSQVGVPKDQVMLITNEQATLANLKRVLGTELRRKASQKDTVIIYYAGHGAPEIDASSPDDDGLEKYMVPYDGDPNDLYTTGLPMREVETILQRLSSERVVFISDACYSGASAGRTFAAAARRATITDAYLARLAKAKGRVVITASRANEVSEERDSLGHGVFTYYLLEGLRGKADVDGDGVVSVDEAYNYVAKMVPEATGQNQHPVKRGEVEGQLILGKAS